MLKRPTREKQRRRTNSVAEKLTHYLVHRLKSLVKTYTHQKPVLSPPCQECFSSICYDVGRLRLTRKRICTYTMERKYPEMNYVYYARNKVTDVRSM